MTDHQNSSAESCELQTLLEVRDFLRDISTGADVTDASRDSATEFVALLDAEYAEKWEGSDGEPSNGKQPLMASRPAPPVPSDHTFSVAQSAQETALRDIVSWKEDVLGDRSKPRGPYDCAPEVTEAFDRGARMAFYRCALRASEALASQPSPAATVKDTPKQFLMQRDPAAPVETEDDTEDMAAVGRAFMEAIEQARLSDPWVKTWAPIQCPSEIIFDLLNREVDQESQAKEPEASGGLCAVAPHAVQVGSSVVGSRTATSERMDVTAGETAPHFHFLPAARPLILSAVPSAMPMPKIGSIYPRFLDTEVTESFGDMSLRKSARPSCILNRSQFCGAATRAGRMMSTRPPITPLRSHGRTPSTRSIGARAASSTFRIRRVGMNA
jgi:hypothetical protein